MMLTQPCWSDCWSVAHAELTNAVLAPACASGAGRAVYPNRISRSWLPALSDAAAARRRRRPRCGTAATRWQVAHVLRLVDEHFIVLTQPKLNAIRLACPVVSGRPVVHERVLFDCNSWLIFIMSTSWSRKRVSRAFETADGPCQLLVAKNLRRIGRPARRPHSEHCTSPHSGDDHATCFVHARQALFLCS